MANLSITKFRVVRDLLGFFLSRGSLIVEFANPKNVFIISCDFNGCFAKISLHFAINRHTPHNYSQKNVSREGSVQDVAGRQLHSKEERFLLAEGIQEMGVGRTVVQPWSRLVLTSEGQHCPRVFQIDTFKFLSTGRSSSR